MADLSVVTNQFYPYEHVHAYGTFPRLEEVPFMVRNYLMDMPSAGYEPPDDNRYYRCQLMKYLYYDDARPLDNPLPTPAQKLSLVYDPDKPDAMPTEKGYRIYTQEIIHEAQRVGQTIMRVYMGPVYPTGPFTAEAGVRVTFLSNLAYDPAIKTTVLSKTFAMACLAMRALNGLNLGAGVGTLYFNRKGHADSNIYPINDESTNVGYRLTMGLEVMGTDVNDQYI